MAKKPKLKHTLLYVAFPAAYARDLIELAEWHDFDIGGARRGKRALAAHMAFRSLPLSVQSHFSDHAEENMIDLNSVEGFPWGWDVLVFQEDNRGGRLSRDRGETLYTTFKLALQGMGIESMLLLESED